MKQKVKSKKHDKSNKNMIIYMIDDRKRIIMIKMSKSINYIKC